MDDFQQPDVFLVHDMGIARLVVIYGQNFLPFAVLVEKSIFHPAIGGRTRRSRKHVGDFIQT
jgi:hypothetical protein